MSMARNQEAEVIQALTSRFPSVDPAVVRELVAAAFESLREAPVKAYTPVLVEEAVRRQLRALSQRPEAPQPRT